MIQIPPSLPDAPAPRRPEGTVVQTVPAVLSDKPGVNPGVVLNLPTPVLETPTDGMRPRDATTQPAATQVDQGSSAANVRPGAAADVAVAVRPGLNTEGLPQRLLNLLRQVERLAGKEGGAVLWPAGEAVQASRPELALRNLRRALGDSVMFEMQRLQARLVPSAGTVQRTAPATGAAVAPGSEALGDAQSPPPQANPLGARNPDDGLPQNPPPTLREGRANATALLPASSVEASLAGVSEMLGDADALETELPPPLNRNPDSATSQDDGLPQNRPAAPQEGRPSAADKTPALSNQQAAPPAGPSPARVRPEEGGSSAVPGDPSGLEPEMKSAAPAQTPEMLDGDSQPIRDAIRLLLHGELRWQGELSPGVFAKLKREDAWEEDPRSPGALVKGTLVSVDLELPALGHLKVRGMFIQDAVRVTVLPQEPVRGVLQSEFEELRSRLRDRGLDMAQVRLGDREDG